MLTNVQYSFVIFYRVITHHIQSVFKYAQLYVHFDSSNQTHLWNSAYVYSTHAKILSHL